MNGIVWKSVSRAEMLNLELKGYRLAFYDPCRQIGHFFPVGIHWIAKGLHWAWDSSFRWRPARFESLRIQAFEAGKAEREQEIRDLWKRNDELSREVVQLRGFKKTVDAILCEGKGVPK